MHAYLKAIIAMVLIVVVLVIIVIKHESKGCDNNFNYDDDNSN